MSNKNVKMSFDEEWQVFDFQEEQIKVDGVRLDDFCILRNQNRGVSRSTQQDLVRTVVPEIETLEGG